VVNLYIYWPLGIFYGHLEYFVLIFPPFWYVVHKKSGNPDSNSIVFSEYFIRYSNSEFLGKGSTTVFSSVCACAISRPGLPDGLFSNQKSQF
jgi:hypothetical protein